MPDRPATIYRESLTLHWLVMALVVGTLVIIFASWLALQLDFFRGTPTVFHYFSCIIGLGSLVLFALGVLRHRLRLRDDWLVAVILIWETMMVLAAAVFADPLRLCIMVCFFAVIQAGVFRASRWLLIGMGVFAVAGYAVILAVVHLFLHPMVNVNAELIQWGAFTVVTLGAMFLAVDISMLRGAIATRNHQLEVIASSILDMAMHDDLTGLFNRRHAMNRLSKLRELATRSGMSVHLVYFDLDHFKRINDTYGHGFGDVVLGRFAKSLDAVLSNRDFAARIGGEEFLMVLVQKTDQQAFDCVESCRQQWQSTRFEENAAAEVTVSAGIGRFRLHESLTEWLMRADKALYDAKKQGRNRVCVARDT